MKKRNIILTTAWILFLAAVIVFTVLIILDIDREIEEIASQPGTSGVDFLGAGLAKIVFYYFAFALVVASTDIYISLRYFLLSRNRKRAWDIVNGISMFLSVLSMLSVMLIFIYDTDLQLFGLFWSAICILFRIIYGCVRLKQWFKTFDEIEGDS